MARTKKTIWAGLLSGVAALTLALPSFASEPATQGSIQLGVGFRYGVDLNDSDINAWGTGLGLNGGITLPAIPIYVGGNIEYFFGEKVELLGGSVKSNIWQITAEGGYDIGLGDRLVLRPKLGLGPATARAEGCQAVGGCISNSETKLAIIPGATFMVFLPVLSLSFDARYEIVTSDPTAKAFIFSAGIGF
jgi:hypothetical protein